ncbi:phospho-N-acetylmuramoyl-pentapeptide-transferase [Saccharibacillus sp. CPCC 101409]|uniref:phospho-N-acetylmuramoyl-pentapeptide- transferase n=1 Tax=Saccharibacillus sp. CPCC 101409 TaxID=3058041 RepID=UPI002673FE33|nr:phospho-N-acetylmuramoyl-pentapeptide-transferase [Saccharibacillus sp. CPCC 101409]MDO3409210.1 phospho-N-acetylmuramoyl-pentapeptide-transferase [Saccharibacillus sp. CPCC 101409]
MDLQLIFLTAAVSFILAVLAGPLCIPLLKRLKLGQQVRGDGPEGHLKKAGTPTMGGIVILLAFTLAFVKFSEAGREFYALLVATLGFGLVGLLDDSIKIVKKRSLGLTSLQKLAGQLLFAAIFCMLLIASGHSTALSFPGLSGSFDGGPWIYYPFVVLMLLAVSNAVNFTDGVDGLLSSVSAPAFGAYALIAIQATQFPAAIGASAMAGAVLGFFVYNAHPARVFMGDTGSLGIGGAIGAIAVLTKQELLFLVIGGVFVVEMLSVALQVISFKARGKRIFKMSPIHHHYELSGWSERRIVAVFFGASLILAAFGLYLGRGLL